ncbi:tetratricopeptide repeat protein [Carboxylicivirga sp. M1479]|uniref:tetratricopeptide repeat-containing sensor histidine kinase n=1 Tax=Carboxylicivirga sp. M1479 TaxID=2594476 RepID=UPI00163D9AB5|nr:tetratricopeptide repeat protein [Carboxylicivirga sp. M1479]
MNKPQLSGSRLAVTFLLILICFPCTFAKALPDEQAAKAIYNSISQELKDNAADTAKMREILLKIRRKRRKLENNYQPLMADFIEYCKANNNQPSLMKSLDYMGLQERYNEKYNSAFLYHQQSLTIALDLQDSNQMCYNYNNLGQVYRKQDLYTLAVPFFYKALAIQERLKDTKGASYTHNTLGATYLAQQEYAKALYHLSASNQMALERNDKRTMSFNHGLIGEIHLQRLQPDSALVYFQLALELKKKLNYDKGMAVTYHLMGIAYYQKEDFQQAIDLFGKAIEIHERYKTKRYLSLCHAYMGKISLKKNDLSKAEEELKLAEQMAQDVHSIEQLIIINEALTELSKLQSNWQNAYLYQQQTNQWKDSINAAKYRKEIQSLDINYQTEKKEQQIKILSADNEIKNQRLRLGFAVIFILILMLAFVLFILKVRKRNAHQQQEKLRQQLLKSLMNPHFIFNALGSIQNYMYKNEPKAAARYMGNFARLTRSILNNSSNDEVALIEEIDTLKNYLELEQMRVNKAFDYSIDYTEDLETEFIQVPPMLLQPFIENAIKHGVKHLSENGQISLHLNEENNYICAIIKDNGIGINSTCQTSNEEHKSKATEIFNQRMAIIKNDIPNLPAPEILDLSDIGGQGTQVKVYLPILN